MKALVIGLLVYFASPLVSAQTALRVKQFNMAEGIALQGYDPVAYFIKGIAIKGKIEFAYKADGVTYYLSSVENKEIFSKNYKNYEPQYGGWCAYAMGETGEKVEVDPETFKIINGKLYLFYNSLFNNTLPKWNKNEVNLKKKADENWKTTYQ